MNREEAESVLDYLLRSKAIEVPVSDEMFAARIQALAAAGRLENQGDLRKWRLRQLSRSPTTG